MDIELYITELLYDHQEVDIPGLGCFFKKKSAGYYNEHGKLYFPGGLIPDFKQQETTDSILCEHIARSRNISAGSAQYFTENFVSGIKDSLDQKGKAELNQLGYFEKDGETIRFYPGTINFSPENFGLIPVEDIISAQPASVAEVAVENTQPSVPGPVLPEPAEIAETETSEELPPEELKSSNGSLVTWLSILVILGAAATAVHFYYPEVSGYFSKPAQRQLAPAATPDSLTSTDSTHIINPAESEKDSTVVPVIKELPPAEPVKVFEIIGASLANQKEADAFIRIMKARGLTDAHVVKNMPGRRIKVSLGSFNDEESAKNEFLRIRKIQSDAYIQPLNKTP